MDPATGELTGVIKDYVELAKDCLQGQTLEFDLKGYDTRNEQLQALHIEEIDGDNVTFSLRVAPGDMGRVIGRHGRIAKEIRTLMKAAGNRENKRVTVDILD